MMIKKTLTFLLLFCIAWLGPSSAQDIVNKAVQRGIESFYMADFETAKRTLQDAIINAPLSDHDLFYAHLYAGFCNIRLDQDLDAVRLHFVRAIQARPDLELDPMKIPPDLYDQFIAVRSEVVSSIVVFTKPLNAAVVVIEPESEAVSNKMSPAIFRNLLQGSYQVLVTKEGYDAWAAEIELLAGVSDTLNVTLLKEKKSFLTKMWPYGVGVAAAAIIYVVANGGAETPPAERSDLPTPPARPGKP